MSKSFTSREFWRRHAPDFNFELNEEQLIEEALGRGFIKKWGTTGARWDSSGACTDVRVLYEYNPDSAEEVNKVIRDNGTDASEMVQDLVDEELYGGEGERH